MGRAAKEFALGSRCFPTFTSTVLYSTVWYSAVHYSTLRAEHERPIACLVQTLELSETPCFLPGHGSRGGSYSCPCDRDIFFVSSSTSLLKSYPIFAIDAHFTSPSHLSCSRGQTVEQLGVEATLFRLVVQVAWKNPSSARLFLTALHL